MRFKLAAIIFLFVSFSVLFGVLSVAYAAKGQTVVLEKDEVINNDYFAAGDRVTVSGIVNGDVYVAGGEVTVDGTVNGDVLAAGGKLKISGEVTQNIRVAGGEIEVSGSVGRNVTAAGGTIVFDDTARVNGGVVLAGGRVTVAAPIMRNVMAGASELNLESSVGGNVTAAIKSLVLSRNAMVQGDVEYFSENAAAIPNGVVAGQVVRKAPPVGYENANEQKDARGAWVVWRVISLVSAFIVGLLLLKFAPHVSEEIVIQIRSYPWRNLGIGVVLFLGIPLMTILLFVLVFGFPLAMMLLVFYGVGIYLAGIYFSMFLGRYILHSLKSKARKEWSLLLGLVVYGVVISVPLVGWFASFISMLIGLGAFAVTERRLYLLGMRK